MTRSSHQAQGPGDRPQDYVSSPVIWAKLVLGHPESGDEIPVYKPEDAVPVDEAAPSAERIAPTHVAPDH